MANGTAKMFGCPVCGFRVSTGDDECPRCGNEFKTSTKFECPFCGDLVEPGVNICPSCHVNYSDFKEKTEARGGDDAIDSLLMEIIKLESQSVNSGQRKFGCPNCSWLLDGTESKCPKCGKIFSEDVTFQCPVCGSPVSAEADRCSDCGSAFDEERAAAQRETANQQASSALDEIMSAASYAPETSDSVKATRMPEPEGDQRATSRKNKVSSVYDRITEAVRQEPKRQAPRPEPAKKPEPEPAPEPAPEPEVAVPEAAEEKPEPEPGQTTTDEEPKAATPAQPKKSRQRKLKAKPKQA